MRAQERVARGAALLDQERDGWADRIDPDQLDLTDTWACPLGQVFSSELGTEANEYDEADPYYLGVTILGIDGNEVEHGFNSEEQSAYDEYDALWAAEVRRRRTGGRA